MSAFEFAQECVDEYNRFKETIWEAAERGNLPAGERAPPCFVETCSLCAGPWERWRGVSVFPELVELSDDAD
eukprot:SAG25_NODE_562_length_6909_cov_2.841557_2_plen_72_part_00